MAGKLVNLQNIQNERPGLPPTGAKGVPAHCAPRFWRKVRFLGKIQKLGVRNSMTYRVPNARKSNFATEPACLPTGLPPSSTSIKCGSTGRFGFDHRSGHSRPLRIVARILACHIYLRLGRFGLAKRL